MPVYLSLAKDKKGNFYHIDSQKSGKCELLCPFFECSLIAIKGSSNAAHYRHDGATCNESLNEIPKIPAWDHFHLNYPVEVIEELKKGYQAECKSPNVFKEHKSELYKFKKKIINELLKCDNWTGNLIFTDIARIILGSLTLVRFSQWMRSSFIERIDLLKEETINGKKHKGWLYIEAHRQQAILKSTLYLFKYKLENGSEIYKIGRTTRDTDIRLQETVNDLEKASGKRVVKYSVLREVLNAGHVEKYALYKYKKHHVMMGKHTEYLSLDEKSLRKIKGEFTNLSNNNPLFNKKERYVTSGRWRYEEKRLAALKRGIQLTLREKSKFGRPKGTKMKNSDFLYKHSDIVGFLLNNYSINQTAQLTQKGRSTVKRVKKAMGQNQDY